MSKSRVFSITAFIFSVASFFSLPAASDRITISGDADVILRIHKEMLAAHLNNDAAAILGPEDDIIVVAGHGEFSRVSKVQRIPLFEKYMKQTRFSEYRDLVPPVVRISDDGSMGWLIAQVHVVGEDFSEGDEGKPFDLTWAWIELYEKRDHRWIRIGEVSSFKHNPNEK